MVRTFTYSVLLASGLAVALDANVVFSDQKLAVFPDTAEIHMQTSVTMPGQLPQLIDTKLLCKGKDKSVTEIKSPQMNMKMVRNGQQMGMVDLKTGKVSPAQNVPANQTDVLSFDKSLGTASDYQTPVLEDSLWRLDPKDPQRPTLYYSAKVRRIVKMKAITAQGATSESIFQYCQAGCALPGSLSMVEIRTALPGQVETKVVVNILSAVRRMSLSDALFAIPK